MALDRLLLAIVFVPLAAGLLVLLMPRSWLGIAKAIALSVASLVVVIAVVLGWHKGLTYTGPTVQIGQLTVQLGFVVTGLGWLVIVASAVVGLLIILYSIGGISYLVRPCEYYGSILLTLGGAVGVALSTDLLELLAFWEVVTVCLYILIATAGGQSGIAATKAFVMTGLGDGALLLAVALLWACCGSSAIFRAEPVYPNGMAAASFLLIALAATTKAGTLPLHTWLPTSAQSADASAMAFLPAALDKLLGIYLLAVAVKHIFAIDVGSLQLILVALGSLTVIVAVMLALVQHDLKRLLAYHAISQVGYMVLGIATLTPIGTAGGLFHMLNHVMYKSCLFLCAGIVERKAGTSDLARLGGLGRRMPITFLACLMSALAISGVPPFNGFASKWMVYQAVIQMGHTQDGLAARLWPIWFVAGIFGSALTLASFVKVLHSVCLSRSPEDLIRKEISDPPYTQTIPILFLAFVCLGFGLFYPQVVDGFINPSINLPPLATLVIGRWDSLLGMGLMALGLSVGTGIIAIGMVGARVRHAPTWTCGETIENDRLLVPGTGFYTTIASLPVLKGLYAWQEVGYFDLYRIGQIVCSAVTGLLRFAHSGILPMYVTWAIAGLLVALAVLCRIW